MSDKPRTIGRKLLSLFVVQEDEEESKCRDIPPAASADPVADDLIARYVHGTAGAPTEPAAAPAAPQPAPPPVAGVPVSPAQLDFASLLQRRGLGAEEQAHVDRALALLANLPKETPTEIQRQIVAASLAAFGVSVDRILESALLQQRLLDQHVLEGQRQTEATVEESNRRLRELEQEAARIRQTIQDLLAHQESVAAACRQQRQRVQEVLDFFGSEAVARVSASSARLRD
ncbi:MAG: hypothetical protein NZ890_11625 [Myxococcota bacterium]|nr:hypothetical protein [Myxococcota bacterium]